MKSEIDFKNFYAEVRLNRSCASLARRGVGLAVPFLLVLREGGLPF